MLNKKLAYLGIALLAVELMGCAAERAKAPTGPAAGPANDKAYAEAIAKGDAAWQALDYDQAIYNYVKAINRRPGDSATLAKIGVIEDARGKPELAEKAFSMAHDASPDDLHIAERLAGLYVRDAQIEPAAKLYSQVLAQDASRARSLQGMGEVCSARSDFSQAITYFDRALKADNADTPSILLERGTARLRLNDLQGAEADLSAALHGGPALTDAWRYLGDIQVRRGDNAAAIGSFLHTMTTAEAYNEIGVVLLDMKDFTNASDFFSRAIKASPAWFEDAQRNLALANEHLRDKSS